MKPPTHLEVVQRCDEARSLLNLADKELQVAAGWEFDPERKDAITSIRMEITRMCQKLITLEGVK